MFVQARQLAKSYGPQLVFKKVGFEADKGEILLLLGSNGSGKSTLLKLIAGVLKPSAGDINITPPGASIGYMAHNTFLYPQLTALENIGFWCKLYGKKVNRKFLASKLNKFDLGPFLHERISCFSRGMAQKLNFLRLLCIDPDILLLDEPATGLDKEARQLFGEELMNLKNRNTLIFWVTHFPEFNSSWADRVLEIKNKTSYLSIPDQ